MGNKSTISFALTTLAELHLLYQGDPTTVHSLLEEALALNKEVGDKPGMAIYFLLSAQVALSQGDAATARRLAEESVMRQREIGDQRAMARALSVLGEVETSQGTYATARSLYEQSLEIAREVGDKWSIAFYLEAFAGVVAAQGELTWAARLWGAAEVLREATGTSRPPFERISYEHAVAAARTRLGEKVFAAAWAEGRTLTPEQALSAQGQATVLLPTPSGQPLSPPVKRSATYPDGLTAREVEVLRLVAQGLTNEQVAQQLVISPRTVDTHLTSIYSKIGVSSRSAATRYAMEHHLL
jgi:ATP/maltotriose-dependent transcriptional regulator MalT